MEPDLGGEEPERRDWLAAFSRPDTEWDYKRFETKVRVNLKPLTSTFRSDVFEDSDGASWRLLFELKVKPSDKKALGVFLEFKPLSGARQARRKFSFTLDSWPEDLTEEPDGTAISREPPHSFNATYSFECVRRAPAPRVPAAYGRSTGLCPLRAQCLVRHVGMPPVFAAVPAQPSRARQ